ncbi:3-oxoacyl-[acyl-carrier-protein] synthase III C-terminal domain-containing protein [Streptomyces parvus]|uniref:3-oxoacyl-[acyl-carrier-protein] synthase III C-terminal domain-containing protein n=1 Tax=Streptomyces sp. JL1001 TaxID=3078227 RepID=A0AAU8KG59_9ACTN|nr:MULTISPECIES: 3-oxoacyl-[acyl-carrier-protein] synthase III C-terminal domain-containing protein [unclassified Streptomyces]PJN34151.1 3-oxoacyl-ACP synthase [Streptomyces sp. CB02613]SCD59413.1 3-oxoacyl-[acyl-carrier-protein] synthase-3 [Streptomyces sp. Termitarium-T10T-6]
MSIGIGEIHCLLPTAKVAVEDLPEFGMLEPEVADFARGSGVRSVGVFEETEQAPLAARACQELFAKHPGDPDTLLMVGPRAPDVLLGSDVGRVQSEAGLTSAFAFSVDGLGCTGSSVAWALARDLLAADPSREQVVITHASRPTGVDRVRFPVTVVGDAAYAMTMVRGGRPVLRAHRQQTDGSFHDLFRVDYKESPWYEWREVCEDPARYRFGLATTSQRRLGSMVEQVLADAGVGRDRVKATLMQNVTAAAYDFYTTLLGLPIHPICGEHLSEYGHLGAMDVVLNLDALLARNELERGDLVVVLNNSPVAAWAVTLWEI